MDPQDARAAFPTERGEGYAGPEAIIHRGGACKPAKKGFARDSDEERTAEIEECGQLRQEHAIMLGRFSKSDSWIKCDAHRVNAASYRARKGLSKKFPHFTDYIMVCRGELHRARFTLHVHDDDACLR
jgi:hypothetical protein